MPITSTCLPKIFSLPYSLPSITISGSPLHYYIRIYLSLSHAHTHMHTCRFRSHVLLALSWQPQVALFAEEFGHWAWVTHALVLANCSQFFQTSSHFFFMLSEPMNWASLTAAVSHLWFPRFRACNFSFVFCSKCWSKFFQECVRSFVKDSGNGDVLVLHVQDPFHRLLLHGVCEVHLPILFKCVDSQFGVSTG